MREDTAVRIGIPGHATVYSFMRGGRAINFYRLSVIILDKLISHVRSNLGPIGLAVFAGLTFGALFSDLYLLNDSSNRHS